MTLLLLLFIVVGLPIAFAMAIAGGLGIVLIGGLPTVLYTLGTYPVSRTATFVLSVIPLFILMGNLAFAAGVASDAYSMASKWLGRVKGSLVLVTIASCGLMAATTGSSVAEAAVMGKIAIPEMKKYGYDIRLATGSVACAGTVGILIPPSISLVIYGIATYESIGKLFMAGILPGILSVIIYMAMVYVRASINPQLTPLAERASWSERVRSLAKGWGILVLFLTVMGGLYTGIVSPTEVGALGCLIGLVMVFLAISRRTANWDMLKDAVAETAKMCAMIFAFIVGAGLFGLFITMSGIIPFLVGFTTSLAVSRLVILIGIIFVYLLLGMFLDPIGMILITVPVVYPILVEGLGYDGIWFGIILVKMIEIALITPPHGMNIFVIKSLNPEVSLKDILIGSLWFLVMDLVTVAILIAFPSICTWLPSMMR